MKLVYFFSQMALILSNFALAAPAVQDSKVKFVDTLPAGYTIVPAHITGTIGDIKVNHTGTVEEILAQLTAENPGFVLPALNTTAEPITLSLLVESNKEKLECFPIPGTNWQKASTSKIWDGINYLRRINTVCYINPHSCARISCSWNSAIFLCNDNSYSMTPSSRYLSGYAEDICNHCGEWQFNENWSGGREYDTDRYGVYVMQNNC